MRIAGQHRNAERGSNGGIFLTLPPPVRLVKHCVVADELGIRRNRLSELILRKRSVTADTAIRLERRFKMPARFWLHLQADYDLQAALNEAKAKRRTKIA